MSSLDTPGEGGVFEGDVEERDDPEEVVGLEVGTTGLRKAGGIIDEEFLTELRGTRGQRIYREMRDNEPTIGGMMFAVEMSLRSAERHVRPADDLDPDALAVSRFVESCFDDLSASWEETLTEILSMMPHGFSVHEIVYKRRRGTDPKSPGESSAFDDGLIGWRKFPIRAQDTIERWEYDDEGGIAGVTQVDPDGAGTARIPIEKMLLFRTTSHKGNPEGRSILRNAYRPWFFKKRIEEFEAIGIERELAGLPVIYAPASIFGDDAPPKAKAMRKQLLKTAQRVRRDQQDGMVFPLAYDENGNPLYRFELASSNGKRAIDTGPVIQRKMQEIALTVLADFILLGHENVGSYALSQDKTNLFATAMDAYLAAIADVFNRHAIPRLLRLNGIPTEYAPRVTFTPVNAPTLSEVAEYLTALADAGALLFPDERLEGWLRERAGLPAAPSEDEEETVAEASDRVPNAPREAPSGEAEMLAAFGLKRVGDRVEPIEDDDEIEHPDANEGVGGPASGRD